MPLEYKRDLPGYLCPECGECVGYVGRFFAKIFGNQLHNCDRANVKKPEVEHSVEPPERILGCLEYHVDRVRELAKFEKGTGYVRAGYLRVWWFEIRRSPDADGNERRPVYIPVIPLDWDVFRGERIGGAFCPYRQLAQANGYTVLSKTNQRGWDVITKNGTHFESLNDARSRAAKLAEKIVVRDLELT